MDIKEFKENWGLTEIPTELEKLIYFQTNISSYENYSDGFGVLIDEKWGLKSWSEDDYEESEDLDEFLKWLKDDYNLDKIEDTSTIISSAQDKYKENFEKWFKQYYSEE